MQHYRGGEVVLVTFPFSDQPGAKRRPALVLRDTGDNDVIVARITSQSHQPRFDVVLADWPQAGLDLPSIVRVHKLHTLSKRRIEGNLGVVTASDWAQVRDAARQLWAAI